MKKNNLMPNFWKWFPIIIFGIIILYSSRPTNTIEWLLLLIAVFVTEIAENTRKEKDKNNNN